MNNKNNIYVVKLTKPPTYIKTLTNDDNEIILVHSKVRNIENADDTFIPEGLKNDISLEESLLDTTGSPMKYSFDNTALMCMSLLDRCQNSWLKEEESHYPLTIEQARDFIQNYFKTNTEPNVVWCVCDGLDKDKTVLMSYQKQPNFISRNIVKVHGYFPESQKEQILEDLNQKHNAVSKVKERQKESRVFYELYGSLIRDVTKDVKTYSKGYVSVEVSEGSRKSMTLNIQALVGHPDAATAHLWQELLLLELYINTLSQYESEQMRDGSWLPTRRHTTDEDPVVLVTQIIYQTDVCSVRDESRNTDMLGAVEQVHERTSLDITDRLWSILTSCRTYGSLVDCLNAFMTEAVYNRAKIHVAESNKSWFATLLRALAAGTIPVPTFTGTQPIQLLILLGIEKLRKDYVHILGQANLVDERQINTYFSAEEKEISRRAEVVLRGTQLVKMDRLCKDIVVLGRLETLCELLCLVPSYWLRHASDVAVRLYLGPDSPILSFVTLVAAPLHALKVPLLPLDQREAALCRPAYLSYVTESKAQHMCLRTQLHLAVRPTYPPCVLRTTNHETDEQLLSNTQTCSYHYTTLLEITNYFNTKG